MNLNISNQVIPRLVPNVPWNQVEGKLSPADGKGLCLKPQACENRSPSDIKPLHLQCVNALFYKLGPLKTTRLHSRVGTCSKTVHEPLQPLVCFQIPHQRTRMPMPGAQPQNKCPSIQSLAHQRPPELDRQLSHGLWRLWSGRH
jgi:hypothetical protein